MNADQPRAHPAPPCGGASGGAAGTARKRASPLVENTSITHPSPPLGAQPRPHQGPHPSLSQLPGHLQISPGYTHNHLRHRSALRKEWKFGVDFAGGLQHLSEKLRLFLSPHPAALEFVATVSHGILA